MSTSTSSGKKSASAKDLPEVFILKKEVQFDSWRQIFAEACRNLGVKKILRSTPAMKDRTAKYTATSREAEDRLSVIKRRGEPKAPVKIKEQKPELSTIKPEEREAAMLEYYGRMETADAGFEKEWGKYLLEKRTYDGMLRMAEEEVFKLESAEPSLDDDVVEIHARTKKEGSRTYEYKPMFSKTQTLDAEEEKLFGVDSEWISGDTGEYETPEETTSRMRIWGWLEKSLGGGPCKHLTPACGVLGDVRSVYYGVKEKCTRVTVLTFGLALSDFFRKDKFLKETDPQIIYTSLKQEASTLEEMGKRLRIPKTMHSEIVKSQLMVALMMSDPEKANQKAMMDMVSGDLDFTSEELVEHLQKQQILARELKGVKPDKPKKYAGVEANELTAARGSAKAIGICYDFQSEEGCLRKNCHYRHEELPTNSKPGICYDFQSETGCQRKDCHFRHEGHSTSSKPGKALARAVTFSGKCRRCAKRGHRGEECPDVEKLLCSGCGKKGHCEEACLSKKKTSGSSRRGGKGASRGRGGKGMSKRGGVNVNALEIEGLEESSEDTASDDSGPEYHGTMVLQSREVEMNTMSPRDEGGSLRLMIDSGCDALAMIDRNDGYDLQAANVRVNEATEGSTAVVDCKGSVDLELPMGGVLKIKGAIFSKSFRHNLIGTSTLGQVGISTFMHDGKVYLIEAGTINQLPEQWKIRACEGVDRDTGLPFITMKRSKSLATNTVLSGDTRQQDDLARAKEINANRRNRAPSGDVAINLSRSYSKREGSHKSVHEWELAHQAMGHPGKKIQAKTMGIPVPEGNHFFCEHCAMGGGKFHAHVRKPRKDKRLTFAKKFKGQERPRKTLNDWVKDGILKQHRKGGITLEDWQELLTIPTNWDNHDIKPGENTATDISGPHTKSLGGSHYTITLVCRKITYRLIRTMRKKSNAPEAIRAMIVEMEARSGNKMRRLRADGDGSYTSKEMKELLGEYQVFMEFSSPYDHPQNGAAENAIGLMEKDVKVSLLCSGAPKTLWGEAVGHHQVTRNNLRSRESPGGGESVSPAYLLEKRQMSPEDFVPFGALVVVAIAKNQRKDGKTITQKVGWTGACVGYGELTGHGGALRIYNPEKRAVKVVSRNLCTINVNTFYWKEKKTEGWVDTDSSADWLLTPEALIDPEELEKYGFDDDILAELAVDLSVPDEEQLQDSDPKVATPRGEDPAENGVEEIPPLEDDPNLTSAADRGGTSKEVVQFPEPASVRVERRSGRKRNDPPPQQNRKTTRKTKPLKENQGYIDGIVGEEIVEGQEHIIVHWEGFASGNDTSSMAKSHAKRFPVLKKMLREYEENKLPGAVPVVTPSEGDGHPEKAGTENQDVNGDNGENAAEQMANAMGRARVTRESFSINSCGDGGTRLPVPLRASC